MIKTGNSIINSVLEKGLISEADADDVLNDIYSNNRTWEDALVDKSSNTELEILHVLADILDYEVIDNLNEAIVSESFLAKVPVSLARKRLVIGIEETDDHFIVATSSPLCFEAFDEISLLLGKDIEPVVSSKGQINGLIGRAYQQLDSQLDTVLEDFDKDSLSHIIAEIEETEDLTDLANKPPIVKLVNSVLSQALKERASDIHFHPTEDSLRIRIRVDGQLEDIKEVPKAIQDAVISRIKVRGKMNIAERRAPQDGRTSIRFADREIDLRISIIPTIYGERAVMRILDKSSALMEIEDLGFSLEQIKIIEKLIRCSYGILLVTGPTGSGKTTSLYSFLSKLDSSRLNIMTIEDPVEYQLPGISQVQVEPKKNLDFSSGLRTFVRQDPDIIMVGEIRDLDTANIAIQAALTGHMVYSTLHTNDASGAVSRLLDLGVEPYLVCSSVVGVIAQRLVRLLCEDCKESYIPLRSELDDLGITGEVKDNPVYRAIGCEKCSGRGYRGRIVISEVLVMSDEIKDLVVKKSATSEIKRLSMHQGLVTLRMDGINKVLEGRTTIEEVLSTTHADMKV